MVPLEVDLGKEKWLAWGVNHWVCEGPDGEVRDEITRDTLGTGLFYVKSAGKQYTSLKAAQAGSLKYRLTDAKKFHEDLLMKKQETKDAAGKIPRGRGVRRDYPEPDEEGNWR
jgi:hypothetical protein